jgi:hypothetical protein
MLDVGSRDKHAARHAVYMSRLWQLLSYFSLVLCASVWRCLARVFAFQGRVSRWLRIECILFVPLHSLALLASGAPASAVLACLSAELLQAVLQLAGSPGCWNMHAYMLGCCITLALTGAATLSQQPKQMRMQSIV